LAGLYLQHEELLVFWLIKGITKLSSQ